MSVAWTFRQFSRFVASALLGSSLLVGIAQPAGATVACRSGYGSLWDGYITAAGNSLGTFEGTSGRLTVQQGTICDDDHSTANFTMAWTFISENESQGAARGYAQMGYFRSWGGCTYYFDEWKQDVNHPFSRQVKMAYGCLPNGTIHQAWEQWVNVNYGAERLNIDSVTMDTTPFNPYIAWDPYHFGNMEPEVSEETKYLGTNAPGSATAPTQLTILQLQQYNDAWTNTLPTFNDICPWPTRYVKTALVNQSATFYTGADSNGYRC